MAFRRRRNERASMSAAGTEADRGPAFRSDESQFLTFTLADEEYGIDTLKVHEIKGYPQ